jgi:hypothetical protein
MTTAELFSMIVQDDGVHVSLRSTSGELVTKVIDLDQAEFYLSGTLARVKKRLGTVTADLDDEAIRAFLGEPEA